MQEATEARIERHLRETLGPIGRRRQGAYYTPLPLARAVVRAALALCDFEAGNPLDVLDPAAGAGEFLLAARTELDAGRRDHRLVGVDIDAGALAIAGARLPSAELLDQDALDPAHLRGRRFDLVIGNPPYGLKCEDATSWGLPGRRIDSYAAFLAMGLTRLAPGGVLAMVVADTWLTLRSHEALRRLILDRLHAILRLPQGAFPAAVSTAIVLARAPRPDRPGDRPGPVRVADLTAQPVAKLPEAVAAAASGGQEPSIGRYDVDRSRFEAIAGTRLFVGSPSLADLVAEAPSDRRVRRGQPLRLARLGEVAAVRHGLSTGANARYVRMRPGASGRYPTVDSRLIAGPDRLARVTEFERENGLPDDEPHFVPLDKGMPSDPAAGWLPNYFAPTPYLLDWSRSALADMRQNPGFSWKNWRYFFRPGLTFSVSGAYAPTFRLNSGGVFEAKGSCLFSNLDSHLLLGLLCSRVARYLLKVFLKHTVDTSGQTLAEFPLALPGEREAAEIAGLVADIVCQQRQDLRYDYLRREQPRLDELAAEAYGLTGAEREEIDAWFARRYGRLDAAIRATS